MKQVLIALALTLPSQIVAAEMLFFEELAPKHVMPAEVKAVLRKVAADGIADCQEQLGSTPEQTEDYFTAVPIRLSAKHSEAILVLPTQDCRSFRGAHAINFWVFLLEPNIKMLLSGSQDAMEIQKSSSSGLFNIHTYYGTEVTRYHYNGQEYVPAQRSN